MSPSTPIRLVALDLDGTLLDSKSQISPRTRQAIADAVGRGVIVLPCTGRPLASLPPLVVMAYRMPMRPGGRPTSRSGSSTAPCRRRPPGKPLRSIRSTTAR